MALPQEAPRTETAGNAAATGRGSVVRRLVSQLARGWSPAKPLAGWVIVAAAAFHAAYASPKLSFLVLPYLFALLQLAQTNTWRQAFYSGLAVGMLVAAMRLAFFWQIFSAGAIGLWLVWAFWIGLFVALARLCLVRLGNKWGWFLVPLIWLGLEYFRSELYYLRFSWLSPGYAFAQAPWEGLLRQTGTYGAGLLLMTAACAAAALWRESKAYGSVALAAGALIVCLLGAAQLTIPTSPPPNQVRVTGVQMEFPSETEVVVRLNEAVAKHPDTDLMVLSEYTLADQVPDRVKGWCRKNRRYLIVGGKEPAPNNSFYNTAYVVGPSGKTEFQQVKAVPIQFFKDGLPAPEQKVWNSPWGKLGLCICYDLSYTRVTDQLVRLGAEGLIVPTMDMSDWGESQHRLHARIAPARAAEYGLPIFRLASSGISQAVDANGREQATAPFPGDGAILHATMSLNGHGHLPPDRWLAPLASMFVAGLVLWSPITKRRA